MPEPANDSPETDIGALWRLPADCQWVTIQRLGKGKVFEPCEFYDPLARAFKKRISTSEISPEFILERWGSGRYQLSFFARHGETSKNLGNSVQFTLFDPDLPMRDARHGTPTATPTTPSPATAAAPSSAPTPLGDFMKFQQESFAMMTMLRSQERADDEQRRQRERIEAEERRKADDEAWRRRLEEEDRRHARRLEEDRARMEAQSKQAAEQLKQTIELERERHKMALEEAEKRSGDEETAEALEELRKELKELKEAKPSKDAGVMELLQMAAPFVANALVSRGVLPAPTESAPPAQQQPIEVMPRR